MSRPLLILVIVASLVFSGAASAALAQQVHRLPLADCDDVEFGPDGDLYFACHSPEDRLPLEVRIRKATPDEMDAYVLRVNPKSGAIVFATRAGGGSYDGAWRITVDQRGHAYVTGLTKSRDFPTTTNALQHSLRGKSDAFLLEVGPDGQIVYSTLLGGSGDEVGDGIVVDGSGAVYVGGATSSTDFGNRQRAKTSQGDDAFLCRIRPDERSQLCITFGGREAEKLTGLALDHRGGIYAVGYTRSPDFPSVHPLQKQIRGVSDLFLTRLAIPSMKMTFSTMFGGTGDDSGWGVAVDHQGNAYVAGITDSVDLPGTAGSYQSVNRGRKDAFISRFHLRHGRAVRTTYFGGKFDDESGYDGADIKVDRDGTVWLVGNTYSEDLPVRNATQAEYGGGNGDGFIAAIDSQLRRLCFATYFGSRERDLLEGIAMSPSGIIAVTGVSFAATPAPLLVQIGHGDLYTGHVFMSFPSVRVCSAER